MRTSMQSFSPMQGNGHLSVRLLLLGLFVFFSGQVTIDASMESGLQTATQPVVELPANDPSYTIPVLETKYAESAMPRARGRVTILIGLLVVVLLLVLTEFRMEEEKQQKTWKSKVKDVQDKVADILNKPVKSLNGRLQYTGKELSLRLTLFLFGALSLAIGILEVLRSAMRRHKHKNLFPILSRARSFKITSILALLLVVVAAAGLYQVWPIVGNSLYL